MPEPLSIDIQCGEPDDKGRRLVVASYGRRQHTDRFDTDAAFMRQKWREETIRRLGLRGPYMPEGDGSAVIHEELATALQRAVDDADFADLPTQSLWQPAVTIMANVEHATTEWLWDQHIPCGAISNLSGDPGLGKSQLTCDLGARITRGWPMPPLTAPDGTFRPRGVLFMNAEDDPARTLRPRLEAAGADLRRVHCLRSMQCSLEGEEERPVTLPGDLPAVEQVIRASDVALVVVDPFVAFLDGKLNINNDADVRRCLGQVASVAESTGAAFLLVRHLNKKSGLSAVYRGGGSIGVTGAARAEFMVGVDPADPEGRILACVKSNLAPEPSSLRFSIESFAETSRVRWGDHCDTSAGDLCASGSDKRQGNKSDEAKGIIEDMIAHGPAASADVLKACIDAGISERTYHSVKKELGLKPYRVGFGDDGTWMLSKAANGFYEAEF
ncbi:MAG: hypothetical protein C0485_18230 [Pirellula sp.]|nr:hypothetical protein [Pirellula sp.]